MSTESAIVRCLLDCWEKEEVLYCHWKSSDHMVAALCGETDLDVLVAGEDSGQAEEVAIQAGFVLMQTAPLRQYPGVHDYVAYDKGLDRFIHLHLHYQLIVGDRWVKAYRIPRERELLGRRVWSSIHRTWIVSPVDEILLFCARMCVKVRRPFTKQAVLKEAAYLATRVENTEELQLTMEYPKSAIDLAIYLAKSDARSVSRVQVSMVRKEMQRFLRMTSFQFHFLSFVRLGYRLAVEFNRRILGNFDRGRRRLHLGGVVVAFVGMDGSGKTSAIERSTLFFSQQMDVVPVFLGSGMSGAPWYRRLAFAILGTRAKFKNHRRVREGGSRSKKVPFYYLVWHWICARDRISRLQRAFRARSSGRVVLVDRWPQDSLEKSFDSKSLSNVRNKGFIARCAIASEERVVRMAKEFRPDIIFRFKVSPEIAVQRKPSDLDLEQANQMEKDLMRIEWPRHSTVADVDADRSIDEVDRFIRSKIWSIIAGRA